MTSARLDIMLNEVALSVSLSHRAMESYRPFLASSNSRPGPRLCLVRDAEDLLDIDRAASG